MPQPVEEVNSVKVAAKVDSGWSKDGFETRVKNFPENGFFPGDYLSHERLRFPDITGF